LETVEVKRENDVAKRNKLKKLNII